MKKTTKTKKLSLSRKLFPTFISSIPQQKNLLKNTLRFTAYLAIILFLLSNIVLSQNIRHEYFQMMNDDKKAVVYYLQSIRNLPQFSSELLRLKNVYGSGLETSVYNKEIEEKTMIQKYEQILNNNPYSRDILYSLFLLYDQKGDKKMAKEYLERAKEVDPNVNIKN